MNLILLRVGVVCGGERKPYRLLLVIVEFTQVSYIVAQVCELLRAGVRLLHRPCTKVLKTSVGCKPVQTQRRQGRFPQVQARKLPIFP